MTPTHLYVYIHSNRSNVLERYLKSRGLADSYIEIFTKKKFLISDVENDVGNDEHDGDEHPCKRLESSLSSLDFNVTISPEAWNLLKPKEGATRLNPGYAPIFNACVWDTVRPPCCFTFKNTIVRKNSSPWV